jgi:predicted metal-dependent HD superfamily phosphohydrolase
MMPFKELLNEIKPVGDKLLLDFMEDNVHRCYYEYFRRYHTYEEHIFPGLELLERTAGICQEPLLVALAWWYHDIIYIPGSSNSEVISADKAGFDCIQLGYGNKIEATVRSLVMATQHFKTEPHTPDEKFIHDLDLSILGADPEAYKKYEKLIREEYSFIDDKTFAQGRLQVLEHFISQSGSPTSVKKSLFKTPYFIDTYEKKALENVREERDAIKKRYPTPE